MATVASDRKIRQREHAKRYRVTHPDRVKAARKIQYVLHAEAELTQDHVLPLSKGGGTVAFNIVPACRSCNSSKYVGPPPKPIKLAMGI